MKSSAFGGSGDAPALMIYSPKDGDFVRVTTGEGDAGDVKYFEKGYEDELGIPSREQIPPSQQFAKADGVARFADGSVPVYGATLYASESVNLPNYRQRMES